jgi:uncharacterized FlgJ-related protein
MKYRIIERTTPSLSINQLFVADCIPEIEYHTTYIVQEKKSFIHKWIETKNFSLIEQARVYLKFLKTKKITRVVE